jgi:hypothetical protein
MRVWDVGHLDDSSFDVYEHAQVVSPIQFSPLPT